MSSGPAPVEAGIALAASSIASTVFAGMVGTAELANGDPVEITLAKAVDVERVRRFFQLLSDTSTYYRFFGIRRALPDDELRGVVTERLPDHVTLLAAIGRHLIGVGECVPTSAPSALDVAFAVADEHQHQGVATLLLERLAVIASRCGMERLTAVTLPGNSAMQLVFHTVGLPEHSTFDEVDGLVHVSLDLHGLDQMRAAAARRHGGSG